MPQALQPQKKARISFFSKFFYRPQQVWLRKAMFQIHLWVGLFLVIYLIAVGVTGSILVFKEEAIISLIPRMQDKPDVSSPHASLSTVISKLRSAYPKDKIALIYLPTKQTPEFQAVALRRQPKPAKMMMTSDPVSGDVIGQVNLTESWLGFVHNLHISLLAGRPGFIANGIGALLLLLTCLSGIVLWWPGIRAWKRGFVMDFKRSWKRINWDLHNTIGFYTLAIVSFWAVSTVYFVFPEQFTRLVGVFSRVTLPDPDTNKIQVPQTSLAAKRQPVPADEMIAQAQALVPDARPIAISLPVGKEAPFLVYMARGEEEVDTAEMPEDAEKVYFDPFTGKHLATKHPARNQTAGDWIIWSMIPLHFGNRWGMIVKIIWAVLGISIPVLAVTGVLMYWNRYLSKKWKKLRRGGISVMASELETVSARERV